MQNKQTGSRLPFVKMYSEITRELVNLAEVSGSQTVCLDILKQLPEDIQVKLIKQIASYKKAEYIPFLQLIFQETTGDVKTVAGKALTKLKYLGFEVVEYKAKNHILSQGKVYVSPSRLTGNCIVVFITKDHQGYMGHYFTLFFNHLGVKEYFQYTSVKKEEILKSIQIKGLVELSFKEGQRLIKDAYQQNLRFGTKVATGFSQFQSILNIDIKQEDISTEEIFRKAKGTKLSARKIINSYILALKNMDAALIYDLASEGLQKQFGERNNFLEKWHHDLEKYTFIKNFISISEKEPGRILARVNLVASDEDDSLKRVEQMIEIIKDNGRLAISSVHIKGIYPISDENSLNPLNHKVYTCIYKIGSSQRIKEELEKHQFIHLTGEFKYGVCYKWFKTLDPLEYGIDLAKSVYGEFILTDQELIVFNSELKHLTELSFYLQDKFDQGELQLQTKTRCTIRDIYQVITDKITLSKELFNKGHTYLIPWISTESWNKFCLKSSIINFERGKYKVFHLKLKKKTLEVIFFKDYGVINFFNYPPEAWNCLLPKDKIYPLDQIFKAKEDRWLILKLMKDLKKEPLVNGHIPPVNTKEIANKFQLVIE